MDIYKDIDQPNIYQPIAIPSGCEYIDRLRLAIVFSRSRDRIALMAIDSTVSQQCIASSWELGKYLRIN